MVDGEKNPGDAAARRRLTMGEAGAETDGPGKKPDSCNVSVVTS